ncbi:hypothetical protein NPIL_556101 [Nephila pilipes]|uniref:Uncharacterized protein n=1 Tax=Nephila pilipes TaxID=299642 RepID=A0A8X6QAY7_NEPPI|nr:hypothetical protein NPIL_556101 [Nephila pilipes]
MVKSIYIWPGAMSVESQQKAETDRQSSYSSFSHYSTLHWNFSRTSGNRTVLPMENQSLSMILFPIFFRSSSRLSLRKAIPAEPRFDKHLNFPSDIALAKCFIVRMPLSRKGTVKYESKIVLYPDDIRIAKTNQLPRSTLSNTCYRNTESLTYKTASHFKSQPLE